MRFHCAGNKSRKQISVIAVFRHHEEERFPYPRPGRANATPTGWGWLVASDRWLIDQPVRNGRGSMGGIEDWAGRGEKRQFATCKCLWHHA